MKKDFARKRVAANQAIQSSQRLVIAGVITVSVAAMIGSAGWFTYRYLQTPEAFPRVAAYVERSQVWLQRNRTRLHQDIEKVKKIAANKPEAAPPIHFEFYTALPHMQVKLPGDVKEEEAQRPTKPVMTAESVVSEKPLKPMAGNKPIFDADQLQRAFSEELQKG